MTAAPNALTPLIRQLESQIDAGAEGLPEEVFLFVSRVTPLIRVDLLIRDDSGRTLFTWRSDRFYAPGWRVPGGVIRFKKTAADQLRIMAKRELSDAVEFDPAPILVHESIRPERGDRGHSISLLYKCRLVSHLDHRRRYTPKPALPHQWQWHERCPGSLIQEQRAYAPFMG